MTLRQLAYEALSYIKPSGAANEATLASATAPQLSRIAADLTATMQEIHQLAPSLYRRTLGATLAAPAPVTVTATDGSVEISTVAPFVEGATIFIGGVFNQIFTENAQQRLLIPFAGSSGVHAATLYTDVVPLDATVAEVLDQVFIADGRRLSARNHRGDLLGGVREFPDYGRRLRWNSARPSVGSPHSYWVEESLNTAGGHLSARRLRVMPIPVKATQITYDVRLRAPAVDVADLGDDTTDSTKVLVIPDDQVESLLRPLFLKRWAGSPWFRDEVGRKAIEEDAARAGARLADYHPQQKRNRRMTAPI